jgi:hypothetical protein
VVSYKIEKVTVHSLGAAGSKKEVLKLNNLHWWQSLNDLKLNARLGEDKPHVNPTHTHGALRLCGFEFQTSINASECKGLSIVHLSQAT